MVEQSLFRVQLVNQLQIHIRYYLICLFWFDLLQLFQNIFNFIFFRLGFIKTSKNQTGFKISNPKSILNHCVVYTVGNTENDF